MSNSGAQRKPSRDWVLDRVRRALTEARGGGRLPRVPSGESATTAPVPPMIPEVVVRQVTSAPAEDLWPRFVSRLEALGDSGIRVRSRQEALAALTDAVQKQSLKRGLIDEDAAGWLGIGTETKVGGAMLALSGRPDRAFEADFGITLCDVAVAETGTLVIHEAPGRARLTSLAPMVHMALVPFSRLVADGVDVVRRLGDRARRNGVWITGSSRTADVEGILIRGVHGPGKTLVVGIADA